MTTTTGTRRHGQNVGCNSTVDLHCVADKHGTINAYKNHGCRCPLARRRWSRYMKDYRLRRLRGHGQFIDATGSRRRIRALQALGWTTEHLGDRLGCTGTAVSQLARRDRVHRLTAAKVCAIYKEMENSPGPSRYTATLARTRGWLPPIAWDDDTIDDAAHEPSTTESPARAGGRGHRLSLAGEVDPVVVDRLTSGAPVTDARTSDQYAAYAQLRDAGLTRNAASERLRLSSVARTLFAVTYNDERLEVSA